MVVIDATASTHENWASELMLEHLTRQGVTDRLELVLVDRGVTAAAAPHERAWRAGCGHASGKTSLARPDLAPSRWCSPADASGP